MVAARQPGIEDADSGTQSEDRQGPRRFGYSAYLEEEQDQVRSSSVSNCVLVDTGKIGKDKDGKPDYVANPVLLAMRESPYHVYAGRAWPSMPTYIRVTIGLPEEMERFKTAFTKTMGV